MANNTSQHGRPWIIKSKFSLTGDTNSSKKGPLDSKNRSEHHYLHSQTLTTDPTLGETPKDPPALGSPSNEQPTTNSPSGGYQPTGSSARNPPIAEDPSGIPVAEVNSTGASTSNSQPVPKLRTMLVAVAAASRLGSAAVRCGTERNINDPIEERSDSNEPLSSGMGCDLSHREPDQGLRAGLIERPSHTFALHYGKEINSENAVSQTHKHKAPFKNPLATKQSSVVMPTTESPS